MPGNGGKQREYTYAYPFVCRRMFLTARTTSTQFSDSVSQFPEFGNTTPLPPNSCKMPKFCAFEKIGFKKPRINGTWGVRMLLHNFLGHQHRLQSPAPPPHASERPTPRILLCKSQTTPPPPHCTYDLSGLFVLSFFSANLGTTKMPLMQFSPP